MKVKYLYEKISGRALWMRQSVNPEPVKRKNAGQERKAESTRAIYPVRESPQLLLGGLKSWKTDGGLIPLLRDER